MSDEHAHSLETPQRNVQSEFEAVAKALNVDERTRTNALALLERFLEKDAVHRNFTDQGGMDHLNVAIASALYLESSARFSNSQMGNGINLSQILRTCQLR